MSYFLGIVLNPTSVKKKRARTLYPPIEALYLSFGANGFPEALTQRDGLSSAKLPARRAECYARRDSSFAPRGSFSEATRLPTRDSG